MIDNENERIGDNDKVTNVTDVENVALVERFLVGL